MNKEIETIAEYNIRTEKKRRSRFIAAIMFSSAILYFLTH